MAERLMQEGDARGLQNAIVLVTSEHQSNTQWGTAFVVHSEERFTYLLTCAHVVHNVGGNEMVRAGDRHATVVAIGLEDVDVAVLRVDGRLDLQSLPLHTSAKTGGTFRSAGFVKLEKFFESKPLGGTFDKPVGIYARGKLTGHKAWELRIEEGEALQPGLSGSPVVTENNRCVAIVTHQKGTTGERGIAISVGVLPSIWQNMPEEIFAVPPAKGSSLAFATNRLLFSRS